MIVANRVAVNGRIVNELGTRVSLADRIAVDGREVETVTPTSIVLHKPRGVICARTDPQERRTIYDLLPKDMPHLGHVGRLDFNTEGVLLMTNEAGLAEGLLRPDHQVPRTYEVKIRGLLSQDHKRRIEAGIPLDGRPTRSVEVERLRGHKSKHDWIRLTLFEGKNRHIHRIFESLGHTVTRLRRVSFGGVDIGDLPEGRWRPLRSVELTLLRGFLARR